MGKGTGSFGKRRNKTHTLCVRCGRRSFHLQKSRCSACAYPAARKRSYNWSVKAIRRKTTGTGRMRYLRNVPRRFKTNFREGWEVMNRLFAIPLFFFLLLDVSLGPSVKLVILASSINNGEVTLDYRNVEELEFGFFAAALGSVGGVGGGGIFVPMLTLVIGFDPKTSTAISKCMVTAGATDYYNIKQRHPTMDMPVIDYNLALLFQPMLLLGISMGVVLNVLFAEWMVTILLIALFKVASTKAFLKGVKTWKRETFKEGSCRTLGIWWSVASSSALFSKISAGIFDQLNYTSTCSVAYWILNLLQVPVAVGASAYQAVRLYKGSRVIMSSADAVITWEVHQ
ncbi:hypothetical protein RND71_044082 [Anisodus tanguticus]|uniref:Ribosomal protein L37 n=1 Tax=Anisodus tanguticus TaxID=243964 RepID=A0AAE1UTG9_9SOLA|nr:hypothetical protein RND71_044082 [Anisodus tanguticus]